MLFSLFFGITSKTFSLTHNVLTFSLGFGDSKIFKRSIKTSCVNCHHEDLGNNNRSCVIYFKTNLIFVKGILTSEIFIQTIVHNTFKQFGKSRMYRYWSVVFNIYFAIFLKNRFNFCKTGKTASWRDSFLTLNENGRSSRVVVSYKIGVLENFEKFVGKHLC